ncbi:MAG: 30S ribosomal protein S3ae, partial [Methanosarcinaceae archaeon]|nr:30S ribosomal protein S3ae [Methanosarcinaceae archaeon]
MARKKVQRKLDGWKSKEWFKIEAPAYLNRTSVGDTLASEAEKLVGR